MTDLEPRRSEGEKEEPNGAGRARSPARSGSAFAASRLRGSLFLLLLAGCEFAPPVHSAAVRGVVTKADPNLATVDYWWQRPATARASAEQFQPLWDACRAECYGRLFTVDREEYRLGLMTTVPMVSKQIFEPWRSDAVTYHDEVESTLATIRRTIRFEVRPTAHGFEVTPKVLVERYAVVERRLTAISQYHEAFSGPRSFADSPDLTGDAVTETAPVEYWYPLHRDPDLERDLADAIARRLRASTAQAGATAAAS